MANFFQRIVNAALGTTFGEPTPPAPPAPEPAPAHPAEPAAPRALPRRVEFPLTQAPRRLQAPTFAPQPRTHTLVLDGAVGPDNRHGSAHYRRAEITFTDSQWKRYLYYQALGKTRTARVYALAEVYAVPQLAGASWDSQFDYDEFDFEDWPDADDYGEYAFTNGYQA